MPLTYPEHADRALRYAALAVTAGPPEPGDGAMIRRLHDDIVATLSEGTQLVYICSLGEPAEEQSRGGLPAAMKMLAVLRDYPRLADPSQAPSPTSRWSGRAATPAADMTPVQVWKGLAVEVFLARSCLDQIPRFTTPIRAHVLNDLALTAEAIAASMSDVADDVGDSSWGARTPTRGRVDLKVVRSSALDLQAAAIRVQEDTSAVRQGVDRAEIPAGPARQPRRIHLIRDHTDVPGALHNLAMLTERGRTQVSEVFSISIVLGATAQACADSLAAAGRSLPARDPAALDQTATTLRQFTAEVAGILRDHRARLGSVGVGNPAAIAQARELRTAGVRTLERLASDPAAARAIPDLIRTVDALAHASAVLGPTIDAVHRRGGLVYWDRGRLPDRQWRLAEEREATAVVTRLRQAAALLEARRSHMPRPIGARLVERSPTFATSVVQLTAAIERRQDSLRAGSNSHHPGVRQPSIAPARTPS